MLVTDFSYILPDELIARYPAKERDSSRLMILQRNSSALNETNFGNIVDWLRPNDLLVLNTTKVIPARLFGKKETGGRVEIFLVEPLKEGWRCLLRSSKTCRKGQRIALPEGVDAEVIDRHGDQDWHVRFTGTKDFEAWLQSAGQMPIPPYLNRESEELDRRRYQTVYANEPGAVAAPTAGLHFTPELMELLQKKGVRLAKVVLHIGLGTFQPVRVKKVQEHLIHKERYLIPQETVKAIEDTRKSGGRVIAVGTTSCRTLEHSSSTAGKLKAGHGEADIFIYPGYKFKEVDALLTNFHLPESTLLMLVSAFAGTDFVLSAYKEAVKRQFRFYSYGDAMLII